MSDDAQDPKDWEQNALEVAAITLHVRHRVQRQLLFGLTWWSASAIAMYLALSSPDSSLYWYGGAIGAFFHWYRAIRLFQVTSQAGFSALMPQHVVTLIATAIVIAFSTTKILPEYSRVDSPTMGTCWAETNDDSFSPVACWSKEALVKTIGFASNSDSCPIKTVGYFDPSPFESRYSCLGDLQD